MRLEELEKMYRLEDAYWWYVGRRRLIQALVQLYGPERPRILDVGCGTGGTMDVLEPGGEVYGGDASKDAISFCVRRGHAQLTQCRAEALPYADEVFDVVVCADILEHLEDDKAALSEILRVLRPGGVAIVTVPAYPWLWSEHDEALSHVRRYRKHELRDTLGAAGLRIRKLTYTVSLVFPIILVVRLLNRLRIRKLGERPHTQTMSLPGWLNGLLGLVQSADGWVVRRSGFPFGASLVAVVARPDDGASED